MHVEICSDSRIQLWQLLGPAKGPQQPEMMDKFPSKNLRNHERNNASQPTANGGAAGTLPDNPLTIANLRKGQNLAHSKLPFLWKLHEMLDDVEKTGDDHIVSWLPHGEGFRVHRPKSFVERIIPHYFKQSKYKSFQRQLHLYEFVRTPRGPEAGSYCHPKFIRGQKSLCLSLSPKKIKGKFHKAAAHEKEESHHVEVHMDSFPEQTWAPPSPAASVPTVVTMDSESAPAIPSPAPQWKNVFQSVLVTGASLAAELEEKCRKDEIVPHNGDVCYIFGGCPFRYMEGANNGPSESEELDLLDHSVQEEVDDFMSMAMELDDAPLVAV
eukprot:Nitzschia sp. Nitz4//scaffold134_size62860//58290//59267//NITZ4_006339-RA/size62860-processed-gene-0.48-mRNA-1//-1//CDS//3329535529//2923//frame0